LRWVIAGIAGVTAIVAVAMASRRSHAGGIEFEADAAAAAEGHGGPSGKPTGKAKAGA
jgi:K(+)-stimulated pyrophosphate-energized sodium pump